MTSLNQNVKDVPVSDMVSCGHVQTHTFLDGFYMSRIGIRILIGHYLALQVTVTPPWW